MKHIRSSNNDSNKYFTLNCFQPVNHKIYIRKLKIIGSLQSNTHLSNKYQNNEKTSNPFHKTASGNFHRKSRGGFILDFHQKHVLLSRNFMQRTKELSAKFALKQHFEHKGLPKKHPKQIRTG